MLLISTAQHFSGNAKMDAHWGDRGEKQATLIVGAAESKATLVTCMKLQSQG
jgi:hypothetical protein